MARTVRILSARAETGEIPDPTGQGRRRHGNTGAVALHVVPEWMKGEPVVTASLTPAEARRLATDLLVAAEHAEGNHHTR